MASSVTKILLTVEQLHRIWATIWTLWIWVARLLRAMWRSVGTMFARCLTTATLNVGAETITDSAVMRIQIIAVTIAEKWATIWIQWISAPRLRRLRYLPDTNIRARCRTPRNSSAGVTMATVNVDTAPRATLETTATKWAII